MTQCLHREAIGSDSRCILSHAPKRHDSVVGALDARNLKQRILVAKEGKNKSRAFIYVIVSK